MPHDDNTLFSFDQLSQSMRFDTSLNAGIALDLNTFAPIELFLITVFDHRLITATSKRKINSCTRPFIAFVKCSLTNTDTDRDRCCLLISNIDISYLFQNRKTIIHQFL